MPSQMGELYLTNSPNYCLCYTMSIRLLLRSGFGTLKKQGILNLLTKSEAGDRETNRGVITQSGRSHRILQPRGALTVQTKS